MNKITITEQDRLDLKRMMSQTDDYVDNTDNIQKIKHSSLIREDIIKIEQLKRQNSILYETNKDEFIELCATQCQFLFNNYTDIFNKVIRNEINFEILGKLLYVLKAIEDEKVDQHEGSVLVGKILKELYLDSAVRHGDNLDKKYAAQEPQKPTLVEGRAISWKEYKQTP